MIRWQGKKRTAKKLLKRYVGSSYLWYWRYLCEHGAPKVGDLTQDCTGFNHIIERVELQWYGRRTRVPIPQCYTDAGIVCPCQGLGFQVPAKAEAIREHVADWLARVDSKDAEYELSNLYEALASGEASIDDRGLVVFPDQHLKNRDAEKTS